VIVENKIKLMQRKNSKDCMAAVAAMITGDPLSQDKFKEFAFNLFGNDGQEGYRVSELEAFLETAGYKLYDNLLCHSAILIAKLNDETQHAIFWTGEEIWDPDREEPASLTDYDTILYWLPIMSL